jgi:hypothetical protein
VSPQIKSLPKLLPRSKLRRRQLVSFVAEGLRTGGCLFPVWWGRKPIFFLVPDQYERLKRVGWTPTIKEKMKVGDDLLVVVDESGDAEARYERACQWGTQSETGEPSIP